MNTHTKSQTSQAPAERITLLALLTPLAVEGLAMGDAYLFRNHLNAARYLESQRILRDRDVFDTLLIPCRVGRG